MSGEIFKRIIDDVCKEKNISYRYLSYDWIRVLEKDGKRRHIVGCSFDINKAFSKNMASDKYAMYEMLRDNQISVLEHHMIFNPKTRYELYKDSYIEEALNKIDELGRIIIKANCSDSGKDVYLCKTKEKARKIIEMLFFERNKDTLSWQPFYNIKSEYRCVYLNGEIILVYKKERPFKIVNGEKVYTSWKFNLSQGATSRFVDESEKYYSQILDLAIKAAKTIGITFATVDIAVIDEDELRVVEINSNVCLGLFATTVPGAYDVVKEVYGKAMDYMLEN